MLPTYAESSESLKATKAGACVCQANIEDVFAEQGAWLYEIKADTPVLPAPKLMSSQS